MEKTSLEKKAQTHDSGEQIQMKMDNTMSPPQFKLDASGNGGGGGNGGGDGQTSTSTQIQTKPPKQELWLMLKEMTCTLHLVNTIQVPKKVKN